jgi:hypothetical protein
LTVADFVTKGVFDEGREMHRSGSRIAGILALGFLIGAVLPVAPAAAAPDNDCAPLSEWKTLAMQGKLFTLGATVLVMTVEHRPQAFIPATVAALGAAIDVITSMYEGQPAKACKVGNDLVVSPVPKPAPTPPPAPLFPPIGSSLHADPAPGFVLDKRALGQLGANRTLAEMLRDIQTSDTPTITSITPEQLATVPLGSHPLGINDPALFQSLKVFALQTGKLSGHVSDRMTGAPVTGAVVKLVGPPDQGGLTRAIVTMADGSFAFDSLGKGQYLLSAVDAGYSSSNRTVDIADGEAVADEDFRLNNTHYPCDFSLINRTPETIFPAFLDPGNPALPPMLLPFGTAIIAGLDRPRRLTAETSVLAKTQPTQWETRTITCEASNSLQYVVK